MTASARANALTYLAVQAASAVKTEKIVSLDLVRHIPFASAVLIVAGTSDRQLFAVAERWVRLMLVTAAAFTLGVVAINVAQYAR